VIIVGFHLRNKQIRNQEEFREPQILGGLVVLGLEKVNEMRRVYSLFQVDISLPKVKAKR
jgi:hypothetical protein